MAKSDKHHLEKRGNIWYFVATKNGKRYHEPLSSNLRESKSLRDGKLTELKSHGRLLSETTKDSNSENLLLGEVAKIWAELQEKRIKSGELKESTWRDYRSAMNLYILPKFGNIPIKNIESYHVDEYLLTLSCGGKRKKNILVPLKSIYKMAIKRRYVTYNIMENLDRIRTEKTTIAPFSYEEVIAIIENAPTEYVAFIKTLFFTGARFGELAGLLWKSVDFKRNVIKIQRTLVYGTLGRVKTAGSNREIKMDAIVREALIQIKTSSKGDSHVFLNKNGQCITPDHFREVIWRPLLKKIGLKYRAPLQTRHTFATLAIDAGENLSWVREMLGHSSLQMIFNVYYKWIKRGNDGNAMMAIFSQSLPEFRATM